MMTQFFQVLKLQLYEKQFPFRFYDDSILPGTKTTATKKDQAMMFYDDSILPGTKTCPLLPVHKL